MSSKKGGRKPSLSKLGSALSEALIQGTFLAKAGFGNPIPALFRALDATKGEDNADQRVANLLIDAMSIAGLIVINESDFTMPIGYDALQQIAKDVSDLIDRLASSKDLTLGAGDLANPNQIAQVSNFVSDLYLAVRAFAPTESAAEFEARTRIAIDQAFLKARLRKIDYYNPVLIALSGPEYASDQYQQCWMSYRSELINRFDSTPLFGEDPLSGATLAQVYVPLRCWWIDEDEDALQRKAFKVEGFGINATLEKIYVSDIENKVIAWLDRYDENDCIRLVSGGPGSGKSTFAKRLASYYASKLHWRTLLVPLQRLRGAGNIDTRINEYFENYDEPFRRGIPPINDLGSDNQKDWLIIFDGLDELAREGTTSEKAAQEFASSLNDWIARIGRRARVRFIVLGRAPSMQEASQRLALVGEKTLHVADLRSIADQSIATEIVGPRALIEQDQRIEYWSRWSTAKNYLNSDTPDPITDDALSDLTKEPLLIHLLIMSGFVSEKWRLAADNRNVIYEGIFDQIYQRERLKDTRTYLNDLGLEGFSALMQSLGLAAWKGGGRTGDQATYEKISEVFIRKHIAKTATKLGIDNLGNVAVLFYTRKDDGGDQGYEFLHKSFGEYLTAKALVECFIRWASQVADDNDEFDEQDFISRWIRITGNASLSFEIYMFMRDEVRLMIQREAIPHSKIANVGYWVDVSSRLLNQVLTQGIMLLPGMASWRDVSIHQVNVELSLFSILNCFSRVAYPDNKFELADGGWSAGPVRVPALLTSSEALLHIRARHKDRISPNLGKEGESPLDFIFSHLDLRGNQLNPFYHGSTDFTGCNLDDTIFYYGIFTASLRYTSMIDSNLVEVRFSGCDFSNSSLIGTDAAGAVFNRCIFDGTEFHRVIAVNSNLPDINLTTDQKSGLLLSYEENELPDD